MGQEFDSPGQCVRGGGGGGGEHACMGLKQASRKRGDEPLEYFEPRKSWKGST